MLHVIKHRAKYPSMDLSYAAGRIGGSMTGVLSAGNEQAVEVRVCAVRVSCNAQDLDVLIHAE